MRGRKDAHARLAGRPIHLGLGPIKGQLLDENKQFLLSYDTTSMLSFELPIKAA